MTEHNSGFAVGERWSYDTPPGEEDSTFIVGLIDEARSGRVIHISVERIQTAARPNGTGIGHLPMEEDSLLQSRREIIETGVTPPEMFETGYEMWSDADGGAFEMPLRQVIDAVTSLIAEPPQPTRNRATWRNWWRRLFGRSWSG